MESVDVRVKNGVVWLEDTFGPDWRKLINIETFDIWSMDCCILGQLGDGYMNTRDDLLGTQEDAVRCGFDINQSSSLAEREMSYDSLQQEWLKVLKES